MALWAVLTALVIYFVLFVVPKLPELSARAKLLQLHEIDIAATDQAFCTKLHMGWGTQMHRECVSDLQQFRAGIENRAAQQFDF